MGLLNAGDQSIYVHLLRPGVSTVEAYHLSRLLGYAQQHALRKQILTDWKDRFTEGVDYEITHDPDVITEYEHSFRDHFGSVKLVKPSRGRLFLTWSGLEKVFALTSKECADIRKALEEFFGAQAAARLRANAKEEGEEESPVTFPETETETESGFPLKTRTSSKSATPDSRKPLSRWHRYQIYEKLLDHFKSTQDPAVRMLALMSAEVGLGEPLDEVRALLSIQGVSESVPPAAPPAAPDVKPVVVSSGPVSSSRAGGGGGPLFQFVPNVYYGLKQIGEMAGAYSAVEAGKAADLVAARMGYTHEDIRRKKLKFNDLPQLPDSTSGKLRQMYRFNAWFANQVVSELRSNPAFEPSRAPDLTSFSQGGGGFPKLSQGPFDD